MEFKDFCLRQEDVEAARSLRDFLPGDIFDMHCHIYDASFAPTLCAAGGGFARSRRTVGDYLREMRPLLGAKVNIRANLILPPDPAMARRGSGLRDRATRFLCEALDAHRECVGEGIVLADDTEEDLERLLCHPRICGLKCYNTLGRNPACAQIRDYLPESAWRVADAHGLLITLHLARPKALSDEEDFQYIVSMTRKYPRAKLMLAHAARGFAPWTCIGRVRQLQDCENIWFDLSAVCESPSMIAVLRGAGIERVVWGSDYPVAMLRGKAISLADGFYWIDAEDARRFSQKAPVRVNLIAIENLLAVRQACALLDLSGEQVKKLFYENALRLLRECCPAIEKEA